MEAECYLQYILKNTPTFNDKQFIIFVRTEELNSWSQKEIKPDIDRCMQIVTYTSSNGQNETTEETHHFDVTIHPASCTQPGYSVCNKCGETPLLVLSDSRPQ